MQILFSYMFYFYSLHVSDIYMPIIRRINCINTPPGICHSVQMVVWCTGLDGTPWSSIQTCAPNCVSGRPVPDGH